jgi:hypothetical protein
MAPGTIHAELMAGDAAAGAQRLAAHMSAVVALVAEERALNLADGQAAYRLSPLIAIDQGEEPLVSRPPPRRCGRRSIR